MLPDGQDPYTLLGVTREASLTQIRERYRILAQIWHPDKHQSGPAKVREEATRQMQHINAAYRMLTESGERAARERQSRERGDGEHEGETRSRENRERQARERQSRERRAEKEREAKERTAREEREARERAAREERAAHERQERERQARERQHPRACWTHPLYEPDDLPATATIHPIMISFPGDDEGYTLRAYLDDRADHAAFLGAQDHLLLFRSTESLHRYLTETTAHDLADVPGWDSFMNRVLTAGIETDEQRIFDFDLILYSIRFPPTQWVPRLFVANRDLIREIAEAFDLDDVLGLLSTGSPLDRFDDLLRVADRPLLGWSARRQIGSLQSGAVGSAWRKAIRGIEGRVRWLR